MKLNRENFKKSVTKDDRTMYEYSCNDQNFYLVQGYVNGKRTIKVWTGSEDMLLDDEVGFIRRMASSVAKVIQARCNGGGNGWTAVHVKRHSSAVVPISGDVRPCRDASA